MENQLETIKANLPYGYEKKIAQEVGCSVGTVHNILNAKPASARSSYKSQVITIATRMAGDTLKVLKATSETANELENFSKHGAAS